jgi:putative ABC transport system permease protein
MRSGGTDFAAYVRAQLPALHVSAEREAEIVAELAQQLEQAYEDGLAGGASETEALTRAQRCLGDWERLAVGIDAEQPRRVRLSGFGGDTRYALRFLWRNPLFAAVAIATLAFGIGGNTAVFTLVDTLLLRVLPYRAAQELVSIETRKAQQPEMEPWSSAPDFFDFRDRTQSYAAVAAVSPVWSVVLTARGPAEQLDALYVSSSLFPMLGVMPAAGRLFAPEEDERAKMVPVVVLSYRFWQRRFGGSPDIVGQTLVLDNCSCRVIGVLPASFHWAGEPMTGRADTIDVYFPAASNQLAGSVRSLRYLKLVGRLKGGVTAAQAHQEARALGAALASQFPATNQGYEWSVRALADLVTGKVRTTMLLLCGAVAFVLLMACANVANLLLARAAARQKEIAVRVALGASRARLLRQLLIEGLMLATLGGCAGIPLAMGALRLLSATGPEALLRGVNLTLDERALVATAAAVLACALLAGLPPALRMTIDHTADALRESGPGIVAGHRRLCALLVAGQIAAALVLLIGAGLLMRSFARLLEVRPGIDPHNLVAFATQLPPAARTPEQRAAVWRRMRDALETTPGVTAAGAVSRLPFQALNLGTWVFVEGRSVPGEPPKEAEYRVCTPNYFSLMGIPLISGRLFDAHDDANPPAVAIVNQTMARQFWAGADPVGRRFKIGSNPPEASWIMVVGVVGDVRHFGLEAEPRPEMYRTYSVNPLGAPNVVVRTRGNAAALVEELTAKVRVLDPNLPTYRAGLMETLVERSTAQRRFVMLLLAGFAFSALLVAGVGVYGMVAQGVAQRTAEIGLRMALGASQRSVLALVFAQGARLLCGGVAVGLAAGIALAWAMRGMLFAMGPFDPVAFGAAAGVLAAFALAACYVPARRATRVDPMTAIRQ